MSQTIKTTGIIIRTHDWSETSRIAVIFTPDYGKVRALAKGGRRLKSSFEVGLDLLNVCSIVFIRKNSGGLDLLTEARADERFSGLRKNLSALYAGYCIAELIGEGMQDYDPHPALYERTLIDLRRLNSCEPSEVLSILAGFELAWLQELGYRPQMDVCAACGQSEWLDKAARLSFGPSLGGAVCPVCEPGLRELLPMSRAVYDLLRDAPNMTEPPTALSPNVRLELRRITSSSVSHALGKRPKMYAYLTDA